MDDSYFLQLSESDVIKFDPVNAITNVFFDDCRKQIFIVKSGSVAVKSLESSEPVSFSLPNQSPIIAIKFSADNNILAIQRTENSLELNAFKNNRIVAQSTIYYEIKKSILYGFFFISLNELTVITADGVEMFLVNASKKSMKSIKSLSVSSNWFKSNENIAVLSSNNGLLLQPLMVKSGGTINKLGSVQMTDGAAVNERDVNLGTLYGQPALLILRTTKRSILEIWVYLLDGPAFKKSHVLMLGFSGRVAVSIIDSIVIVHHQTSKMSLLYDVALNGEPDPLDKSVMMHSTIVPGKSIKPLLLKLPSISIKESAISVELYSTNWVIFLPDVIIDVKLGYLFKLILFTDKIQIGDRIKLVEFLMHRKNAKSQLLSVLHQLVTPDDYNQVQLPILQTIFNKINQVYKKKLDCDLQSQMALPSPSAFKSFNVPVPQMPAQIVIEQNDMLHVFNTIVDKAVLEKVLLVYVYSLVSNSITCEYDLSKMLVMTLVGSGSQRIQDLQQILSYNVLHESKALACFLLSLMNHHPLISQMSLDMLKRLNAHEIIVEILLEQGKVIDAIRLAKIYTNYDLIPARKFLEAAAKSDDNMTFFSVYNFFIARNQRLRGSNDFLKSKLKFMHHNIYAVFPSLFPGEQCDNYEKMFKEMFPNY